MKALLIIDMQKVSFAPKTPRYDTDGVIKRINELSERFRLKGDLVIYIQHDGSKEGYCFPDTDEWKILPYLVIHPHDLIISKTANDSFYKTCLKDRLNESGIEDIVITGCATDFCVDSTVKSALINDFNVTVISDCHTTTNRKEISAKKVIEYYNWIWNEMSPTRTKIKVIEFKEYIKIN